MDQEVDELAQLLYEIYLAEVESGKIAVSNIVDLTQVSELEECDNAN